MRSGFEAVGRGADEPTFTVRTTCYSVCRLRLASFTPLVRTLEIQEHALGLGQRLFAAGDRDFPMLEVRQIEFEHANATRH